MHWLTVVSVVAMLLLYPVASAGVLVAAATTSGKPALSLFGASSVTIRRAVNDWQLAWEPDLQLKYALPGSAHETVAVWDEDGAYVSAVLVEQPAPPLEITLWKGQAGVKSWADPAKLVTVKGTGTEWRLRLTAGEVGADLSSAHAALRWEREFTLAQVRPRFGWLSKWSRSSLLTDGEDECGDSIEDPENPTWGECPAEIPGESTPAGDASSGDDSAYLGLESYALYALVDKAPWRLSLSAAGTGAGLAEQGRAHAWSARYQPKPHLVEWKAAKKEGAFAGTALSTDEMRLQIGGAKIGAELRYKHELRTDGTHYRLWRFTTSSTSTSGAPRLSTYYDADRIGKVKRPGWRLQLTWSPTSARDGFRTCSPEACPWVWPDPKIASWSATAEYITPIARIHGGAGIRIAVGESKYGRMNWWQPRLTEGRALSPQSDGALRFDGMVAGAFGHGWDFRSEFTYAEEVKHAPGSDELPQARYWRWEPVVGRNITDDLRYEFCAGWAGVFEFSGASFTEAVQSLRLIVKL